MAENTKTATHTFNPWRIKGGTRVVAAESYWRQPIRWNREAACRCQADPGEEHVSTCPQADRPSVFCASIADVFEDRRGPMVNSVGLPLYDVDGRLMELAPGQFFLQAREPATMDDVRRRLFRLIDATPNLDYLLLTKRPQNIARMTPPADNNVVAFATEGPVPIRPSVWLGASVEDQQAADERIPHLLAVPAAVRFLSVEPLLGPVDLSAFMGGPYASLPGDVVEPNYNAGISWVIVGGESGPHARPCRVEWIRSVVRQCRDAGVPCFVKQLGSRVMCSWKTFCDWKANPPPVDCHPDTVDCVRLHDRKGGDPAEWPADLRVREVPTR